MREKIGGMEILFGLVMIGGGLLIALVVAAAFAIRAASDRPPPHQRPGKDGIEASVLFYIAAAGGAEPQRCLAMVREVRGAAVPIVQEIDLTSWAETYVSRYGSGEAEQLLENAVAVAVSGGSDLPLRQYNALVELTFSLGFHTDVLSRIRASRPFTHEDHARRGRPRSADRGRSSTPLFVRTGVDRSALLAKLGLRGEVSRSRLISTYRTLAAQHHPDRFHDADPQAREAAAARFIEISEAYGQLLAVIEDIDPEKKV